MMHKYKVIILFALVMAFAGCKKKKQKNTKPPVKAKTQSGIHKNKRVHARSAPIKHVKSGKKNLLKKDKPKPFVSKAHHINPKRIARPSIAPVAHRTVNKHPAKKPRRLVPDVRLLLTVADMDDLGLKPGRYDRITLPGKLPGPDYDSLNYRMKKHDFGISIQVWGFKRPVQAKAKYNSLFASLPNARKIDPIEGDTLFANWGSLIYIGFLHPRQRLVVNLVCSKKLCSSNKLYEIAKRVSGHLDMLSH